MNRFIESLEQLHEEQSITSDEESKLIDYIFNNSINQCADDFALEHINYYDALDFVKADDSFQSDLLNFVGEQSDSTILESVVSKVPAEKLAYHLAYSNPTLGTQLLDELLHYRKIGRI